MGSGDASRRQTKSRRQPDEVSQHRRPDAPVTGRFYTHLKKPMKHLLLTTIAAVLLVGCGPKAPKGSVHIYAQEGDIAAVKQHLASGTDVNAKDDFIGMTILQSAALGGQKEIVEFLIAEGADVNEMGRTFLTPLDTALKASLNKEIADLLRKHGGKTKRELETEGK